MRKTTALIFVNVAMIAVLVAASLGLKLVGAQDDVFVLAFILILSGGALAISGTVAHYAKRDERQAQ
jgi:hypothetical protein